jgi:hypothetical protein
MSQFVGIVRGNGRESFVGEHPDVVNSRDEAVRFGTSMEARLAAERLTRVMTGDPDALHRMHPWITSVDAEKLQ